MSPDPNAIRQPDMTDVLARLATIESLLLRLLAPVLLTPGDPNPGLSAPDYYGPTPPAKPGHSKILAKQPPDPEWIAVLHRKKYTVSPPDEGPHQVEQAGCGQVALYLTRPFSTRERADITAMRVCFPNETDWRQPKPGDISLCSTCGMPINPWSDRDLDYASVLVEVPEVHRVRRRKSSPPLTMATLEGVAPLVFHTPEADAQARTDLGNLLDVASELLSESDESGA